MLFRNKYDVVVNDKSVALEDERLNNLQEGLVKLLRFSWWWGRKTFFTKIDTKPRPAIIVQQAPTEIEHLLGRHYFEPGWEFSYNYKGEVLNLRRAEYVEQTPYPKLHWWQIHLRGYEVPSGELALTPHFEPDPTEHPDAHISQNFIIRDRAMETIAELLDKENKYYREEKGWRQE
ncbi:hypothetical protein [Haladaptatus sp. DFWS20]|uniref:hypothetical protein n=1 Tax=Haladaptatus sp. DFWS20 TaxID=3403467 RepID=UPI003EC04FAB